MISLIFRHPDKYNLCILILEFCKHEISIIPLQYNKFNVCILPASLTKYDISDIF